MNTNILIFFVGKNLVFLAPLVLPLHVSRDVHLQLQLRYGYHHERNTMRDISKMEEENKFFYAKFTILAFLCHFEKVFL